MNILELQKEGTSGRWKRNKTKNRLEKIKKNGRKLYYSSTDEALTALFKDPVCTAL
jgi:hypothetical protein